MSLKSCLIFLLVYLFPLAPLAQDISFTNFSHKVTLIAQQQDYVIQGAGINIALSNRLIVKTRKEFTSHSLKLLDSRISNVTEIYLGHGFNYFSAELNDMAARSLVLDNLLNNPAVILVQPDILQLRKNASAVNGPVSFRQDYLEQLGIRQLWKKTKGTGVKIAIIDDGVDLTHPALRGVQPEFLYDIKTHRLSAQPLAAIDSHGTQVAGVIFAAAAENNFQGIAPGAQLIAIRQPDSWTSNTLLAFQLAALAKADVINCSWTTQYLLEPLADVVNDMATYGRGGKGIAVVFSAGNEGVPLAHIKTEATITSAITVGAVDAQGHMLASSNYGGGVDLSVYGAGVRSTANQGRYHNFSGTSLSAAIVSGLAALFISEQPGISLEDLQHAIKVRSEQAAQVQLSKLNNQGEH